MATIRSLAAASPGTVAAPALAVIGVARLIDVMEVQIACFYVHAASQPSVRSDAYCKHRCPRGRWGGDRRIAVQPLKNELSPII